MKYRVAEQIHVCSHLAKDGFHYAIGALGRTVPSKQAGDGPHTFRLRVAKEYIYIYIYAWKIEGLKKCSFFCRIAIVVV